jgi:hypothetical protein
MKVLSRKRVALAGVVLAGVLGAVVADAAVVQQTPLVGYQANGTVRTIIVVGNTAYMGGEFTGMTPPGGGTAVARNHVAAVDMTTGALLPWNPNANGNVYALVANGSNVFLGGTFTTVHGSTYKNLAEVDGTNGNVITSFANALRPNKAVRGLTVAGGSLYVGGAFTTPRPYAAKVNAATGAYIPAFAPAISNSLGTSPEVRAIAVNPSGTRVILGGFFNQLNSGAPGDPVTTNLGIGAVDPNTGASLPWAWHTHDLQTFRPFQLLRFTQDGSTLYGAASGNGGSAISWNMETGDMNYQEGFNGNVTDVAVTDGVLYMGGHYGGYCGPVPGNNFCTVAADRSRLSAVDAATGQTLYSWAPTVNSALGIEAVAAGGTRVAVGGQFTRISGVAVAHFARFAEAGVSVVISDPTVTDNSATQPPTGPVTVSASGSSSSQGGTVNYRYETSTNGGSTWSAATNGTSVTISAVGTTLVRFQAFDSGGHTSNWVTDTVTITSGGGGGTGTVTVHISMTGTAGTGGNATIKGTYTCNGASSVVISGTVNQSSTGASGTYSVTVPCPNNTTSTKWQTLARAGSGPQFQNGSAAVHAAWSATDSVTNQPITGSTDATVTLN